MLTKQISFTIAYTYISLNLEKIKRVANFQFNESEDTINWMKRIKGTVVTYWQFLRRRIHRIIHRLCGFLEEGKKSRPIQVITSRHLSTRYILGDTPYTSVATHNYSDGSFPSARKLCLLPSFCLPRTKTSNNKQWTGRSALRPWRAVSWTSPRPSISPRILLPPIPAAPRAATITRRLREPIDNAR